MKELYGEEKIFWGNYMARRLHCEEATWWGDYMWGGKICERATEHMVRRLYDRVTRVVKKLHGEKTTCWGDILSGNNEGTTWWGVYMVSGLHRRPKWGDVTLALLDLSLSIS